MLTIGILGGFGPQATMDFEQRIHHAAQHLIPQRANQGYPSLLVYYHRRAPFLTNENGVPVEPLQADPRLLEVAHRLGTLVDFLVITSNGAHAIQKQIEQAAGRNVLSMIDVTIAEIKRRGLQRVGALGLFGSRVYQGPLAQHGIACETIADDQQQQLDQAIFAVMEGRAQETHAVARAAVAALHTKHIQAIILGCTEIPFMLPDADADPMLINPAQLLAEAAVRTAIE